MFFSPDKEETGNAGLCGLQDRFRFFLLLFLSHQPLWVVLFRPTIIFTFQYISEQLERGWGSSKQLVSIASWRLMKTIDGCKASTPQGSSPALWPCRHPVEWMTLVCTVKEMMLFLKYSMTPLLQKWYIWPLSSYSKEMLGLDRNISNLAEAAAFDCTLLLVMSAISDALLGMVPGGTGKYFGKSSCPPKHHGPQTGTRLLWRNPLIPKPSSHSEGIFGDIRSTAHLRELTFMNTGVSKKMSSSSPLCSFCCLYFANNKPSKGLLPLVLGLEDKLFLLSSF